MVQQLHRKPFRASIHQTQITNLCENVWGGTDYLPSIAPMFEMDQLSRFHVLFDSEDEKNMIACANLRNIGITGDNDVWWIEAVRTAEEYRNQGMAKHILQDMIDEIVSEYEELPPLFYSCTLKSHTPMIKIFNNIGMKYLTDIHMLDYTVMASIEEWRADNTNIVCQNNLLQVLNIQSHTFEDINTIWKQVNSVIEIQLILDQIRKDGGLGLFPGKYEILSIEGEKLNEAITNGLVWKYESQDDNNNRAAVMALIRDPKSTQWKSPYVLCIAALTDIHVQSAVCMACTSHVQEKLLKLVHNDDNNNNTPQLQEAVGFLLAIDGAVPLDGEFMQQLPITTKNPCVIYGTRN